MLSNRPEIPLFDTHRQTWNSLVCEQGCQYREIFESLTSAGAIEKLVAWFARGERQEDTRRSAGQTKTSNGYRDLPEWLEDFTENLVFQNLAVQFLCQKSGSRKQDVITHFQKRPELRSMQTDPNDKIVRRRCGGTEEGLERPKKMSPWQRRLRKRSTSTESWTHQWTKSLVMLKTSDHGVEVWILVLQQL